MLPHEIILHYSSLVRLSLSPSAKYNEIFSTHVSFFCPIPFVEHHVNKIQLFNLELLQKNGILIKRTLRSEDETIGECTSTY